MHRPLATLIAIVVLGATSGVVAADVDEWGNSQRGLRCRLQITPEGPLRQGQDIEVTVSFARDDATWDDDVDLFPQNLAPHVRIVFDPVGDGKTLQIPGEVLGGPPTPYIDEEALTEPFAELPEPLRLAIPMVPLGSFEMPVGEYDVHATIDCSRNNGHLGLSAPLRGRLYEERLVSQAVRVAVAPGAARSVTLRAPAWLAVREVDETLAGPTPTGARELELTMRPGLAMLCEWTVLSLRRGAPFSRLWSSETSGAVREDVESPFHEDARMPRDEQRWLRLDVRERGRGHVRGNPRSAPLATVFYRAGLDVPARAPGVIEENEIVAAWHIGVFVSRLEDHVNPLGAGDERKTMDAARTAETAHRGYHYRDLAGDGLFRVAVPAEYGVTGTHTFAVDQHRIVFAADLGGAVPDARPRLDDPDGPWKPLW